MINPSDVEIIPVVNDNPTDVEIISNDLDLLRSNFDWTRMFNCLIKSLFSSVSKYIQLDKEIAGRTFREHKGHAVTVL